MYMYIALCIANEVPIFVKNALMYLSLKYHESYSIEVATGI